MLAPAIAMHYSGFMRSLIQQYAKDLTAGRLASGYEHSYRVYHLAKRIGAGSDYDDDVLHAACFLHDILMGTLQPSRSADKASDILRETGFDPAKIPKVHAAIAEHMPGGSPAEVEGMLLYDANYLDSVGAVGMARLAIGSFFWYHYKTMEDVLRLYREQLEKADTLHFPVSVELARERVEFSRQAV